MQSMYAVFVCSPVQDICCRMPHIFNYIDKLLGLRRSNSLLRTPRMDSCAYLTMQLSGTLLPPEPRLVSILRIILGLVIHSLAVCPRRFLPPPPSSHSAARLQPRSGTGVPCLLLQLLHKPCHLHADQSAALLMMTAPLPQQQTGAHRCLPPLCAAQRLTSPRVRWSAASWAT